MNSFEVRRTFLDYFAARGHREVASSSLVPIGDRSLLFTNAGMNQFKDVFLGRERSDTTRAVSSQKCVRAGGKHNDLENVGYTARHHTFFEMLGNFSFGDYFKREAIAYAWELLLDGYGLDRERLWFSVYKDDDEAERAWRDVGANPQRILRFGEKDNFWAMGETGPCGPCSEIHYYRGAEMAGNHASLVNGTGDDTVEIWNLVFMQYNRDAAGVLTPLPKPCVDTGMGLERLTAVLQGVYSNYDTDLFAPILAAIGKIAGAAYGPGMGDEGSPFRVIADHIRAVSFLLADGVLPANEDRGYVLRRILRRAMLYGRRLGIERPFLFELAPVVAEHYRDVYPELEAQLPGIARTLQSEEERFDKVVSGGLDRVVAGIVERKRSGAHDLPGERVFAWYDTHGIPLDLIEEVATSEGMAIDHAGFDAAMEAQRSRARAAWKGAGSEGLTELLAGLDMPAHSRFAGYPEQSPEFREPGATIVQLLRKPEDGSVPESVGRLSAGESGYAILDVTPFYPEGGGQVGDTGTLSCGAGSARVLDTTKPIKGLILHAITVEHGALALSDKVDAAVDREKRLDTQANHTGTHLLHAALRQVLGEGVRQMGSLVEAGRMRFDYSFQRPLTDAETGTIERLVNQRIWDNVEVSKTEMPLARAKERGALMFFGEKYDETVRVVDVPGFSTELCGGCHVPRTGDIGAFKIVSDVSLAAGVRRLEALTRSGALERLQQADSLIGRLAERASVRAEALPEYFDKIEARAKELERELKSLRLKLASGGAARDATEVREESGVRYIVKQVDGLPLAELRTVADSLKGRVKDGLVVVGTVAGDKIAVVAATGDSGGTAAPLAANTFIQALSKKLDGKGGGRPEFAQGGGKKIEALANLETLTAETIRELRAAAKS